jgi:hypothetical protein
MTEKLCIYCHKVTLNGFDEVERKYYEKGTKTLHTRERCEAAKRGEVEATQTKSPQLNELITKVDQLIVMVQDINQKISGKGTLDVEQ